MDTIRFTEINPSTNGAAKKPWILVYLTGSIGDTVVCLPALEAIRRQFPDDKVILLHDFETLVPVSPIDIVPPNLIDGTLSYVMYPQPYPKLREFYRLWKRIRRENVKAVVYLVSIERFGWLVRRDKLFFQLCGIKNLIGFHPYGKSEIYERDADGEAVPKPSEAVFKLRRLERDGINTENLNFHEKMLEFSTSQQAKVDNFLARHRKKPAARLVAICPGCKRPTNDWGIENFIKLGQRLLAAGNFEIVIPGGKNDKHLAEKMIAAWGEGIDATGEFKVNESGALFTRCEFMIGNDTGTTHLAAAAGIPCFEISHYRDNPGHWFPLGRGHLIIQHKPACAACHQWDCPIPERPCMTEIKVDDVWLMLAEFIKEKPTENYRRVLV